MKRPKVFIFIPGILDYPEDINGCMDRACRYISKNTHFECERFEYFTIPFFRPFKQGSRVRKIASLLNEWKDHDIILVGFSNGCDLACRYLKKLVESITTLDIGDHPRIVQVHLVAGATECSCEKNGLNEAIEFEIIRNAYVYCSLNDRALQKAKGLTGWLARFGLGYGWLGLGGPSEISVQVCDHIHVIRDDANDHSDWFGKNFEKTMETIVKNAKRS